MARSPSSVRLQGSPRSRDLAALADPARAAADALMGYENVVYVTLGEKLVSGRGSSRTAMIVYVARKGDVSGDQEIPKAVDLTMADGTRTAIPTDVVELPSLPRTLGMRVGHVILAADGNIGACGLTFRRGAENYALTNSHVVSNLVTGLLPGEPDVQDPDTLQRQRIGDTIYATAVQPNVPTDEDLAIIRANGVPVDPLQISGLPNPIARISNFAAVGASQFWYRINDGRVTCRSPQPVLSNTPIRVDNGRFLYRRFWQLRVTEGAALPGQSGALICAGSGANIVACGLVFGGSSPNYVYAFPMDDVIARVESFFVAHNL